MRELGIHASLITFLLAFLVPGTGGGWETCSQEVLVGMEEGVGVADGARTHNELIATQKPGVRPAARSPICQSKASFDVADR